MRHQIIPVTPFVQNCTLFWDDKTLQAVIIDPGGDTEQIIAATKKHNLVVEKILITHGHIDHAGGAAGLAKKLKVPIFGPNIEDKFWIDGIPEQSLQFGLYGCHSFTPDRWLEDGDTIECGEIVLEVIHCPGHTPGHVVFYHRASELAQVGDVLFHGSIGRTDFPRGNYDDLIASIRKRLFPLGDGVRFISGHGPMSTFGEERRSNPFVSDSAYL